MENNVANNELNNVTKTAVNEAKKEVEKTTNTTVTEQKKTEPIKNGEPEKKSKKGLIIGLIIFVILAIAGTTAGLLYAFIFSVKTVDLSDCMKIEYKGYNGYATATVEIDEGKLKKVLKDSKVAKEFIKKAKLDTGSLQKLSNGDKIYIDISIPDSFLEKNKIKLKEKEFTITVSGIEEFSSLDLSKYINLNLKGFNKHATAKPEISEELKDVLGEDVYKEFVRRVSLSIEENDNLENGKDVEVKVSISESWLKENGIELKSLNLQVPVSGLEDAKEFDAFKDMKVTLSGMSPNLSLSVTNESTDDFVKTVKFRAEKTSGISNGDTIEIKVYDYDKEMAQKNGYVLKELSTKYKVENQASYVNSKSELEGDIKNKIKSIFVEKARSKANDSKSTVYYDTDYKYVDADNYSKDLSVGEPEVVSMYLLTKKTDQYTYDANRLVGIVRVPFVSAKSGVTYNWYITVVAKNISISDGEVSENTVYDVDKYAGDDEDKAYQYYVNNNKDDFNVVSVPVN